MLQSQHDQLSSSNVTVRLAADAQQCCEQGNTKAWFQVYRYRWVHQGLRPLCPTPISRILPSTSNQQTLPQSTRTPSNVYRARQTVCSHQMTNRRSGSATPKGPRLISSPWAKGCSWRILILVRHTSVILARSRRIHAFVVRTTSSRNFLKYPRMLFGVAIMRV
jgi:hypothetical protein